MVGRDVEYLYRAEAEMRCGGREREREEEGSMVVAEWLHTYIERGVFGFRSWGVDWKSRAAKEGLGVLGFCKNVGGGLRFEQIDGKAFWEYCCLLAKLACRSGLMIYWNPLITIMERGALRAV